MADSVVERGDEVEALRRELAEAREALDAIRTGQVDALVVSTPEGGQLFTLEGADFAYRALVEQMEEGAATLNGRGIVLFANQSLAGMLGRPLDAVVGKAFGDFVDDARRASFQEALDACAGFGTPARAEVTLAAGHEVSTPVSVSLRAFDVYGEPTLSMTVVDLTEHRKLARAEAAREAGESYRLAIRATHDAVWDLDLVTGAFQTNESEQKLLGVPPAGVSGVDWWRDHLHPEDRDRVWASLTEALDGSGDEWRCDYRLRRADGSWGFIFDRACILRNASGKATRAIGAMQDRTERQNAEEALRESEEKFRLLAWTAGRLLSAPDPQAFLEELCREVMAHLGCDVFFNFMADEAAARLHLNACAGVAEDAARQMEWLDYGIAVCGCVARDRQRFVAEDISRSDDPRTALVKSFGVQAYCCHPILAQGRLLGTLSFGTRTRPRFTEQEVETMRTVTDQVAAAVQRLVSDKALRGFSATLEQRVAERTSEVQALVVRLRELALELTEAELRERRRVARVLHDHFQQLLVAAKLQLGVLLVRVRAEPLKAAAQQTDDLLTEAIQAARTLAVELSPPLLHDAGLAAGLEWLRQRMQQQHNLKIDITADAGIDPGTDDIRAFIFESIRELLFNVVKHAGVGEATLDVRRRDGEIEVTVSDAGAGLALAPNLVRDQLPSGSGLFSIGQRLELLGGSLSFEKVDGPGTSVRFCIPVEDLPAAGPSAPASPAAAGAARSGRARKKIRVLLADDHRIVRQGFAALLRSDDDIDVVGEAADGEEATELARLLLPDVVVMDVSMPKMSGIDATRWLTANLPRVRVIGLSMHEDEPVAIAMREAGAVAFVTKDGPSTALMAAIHAARPGRSSTAERS